MAIADDLIKRLDKLKSDRSNWDHHWQEVADIFQPRHASFTDQPTPGEKRTQRIYDATPTLVPNRFASAMESLMTPQGFSWHGLTLEDKDLAKFGPVNKWLDAATRRLFTFRYNPHGGFVGATGESYINLGLYGTQILYTEESFGRAPIIYKALPLRECYIATSANGLVDTLYRRYKMTVRQAIQRWGQKRMSEKIAKLADDQTQIDQEIEFLHVMQPRDEAPMRGSRGLGDMPVVSYHVDVEQRHLIAEGGYYEFPAHVSRFSQAPSEIYGRGPGIQVLPTAKMLHRMKRTNILGAEKTVDPPLAIGDDGDMPRPNLRAGAINPGAVNDQGRAMILPIQTNSNPGLGEQLMEVERADIASAFWVDLFMLLTERPGMTATEVRQRAKEKAELVGPAIGKQETEFLGPLIEREYGILARRGFIPPVPDELRGQELQVDYTSPMAKLRRSAEALGITDTLSLAAGLADSDPSVMDNIDTDAALREMADINGVPRAIIRDERDVQRLRERRAQQMEQQQRQDSMAVAAEAAGKAAPALALATDAMAGNA